MANHKSAKKRARQDLTRHGRNKQTKSAVRTFEKKLDAAILSQDKKKATDLLVTFIRAMGKAAQKGVYHAKNASRKISRLSKKVQQIQENDNTV